MDPVVVAIDPGREKCGVAVVTQQGAVLEQAVVPAAGLTAWLAKVSRPVGAYVVGHRTASREVLAALEAAGVSREAIKVVNEDGSSQAGRRRYWQAKPPRGWRRLLPTTLQVPPEPYDDFVAVELAHRYLSGIRGDGGEGSAPVLEN
ncbi:MAG: hypothetical protein LOD91_01915 [Limnochordales bacterium]|nr:hypothetical protein [Limnochordales bacterium]